MARCLEWMAIYTRKGRMPCVASWQGWMVATIWDDVLCELWVEEML
jgi:hypothetical protein